MINDWSVFWVLTCTVHLAVYSCHVTYAFQSESTLYSCLDVKELLAWSWREIWCLSDCNWKRTNNHLGFKWTLNHLAKRAKRLSCVLNTYLHGASVYMFLSCHVVHYISNILLIYYNCVFFHYSYFWWINALVPKERFYTFPGFAIRYLFPSSAL